MSFNSTLRVSQAEIAAFCRKHHIVKMWLFGSALRDDFRADSDIDVLVEFDPAHIPGWDFFLMGDELAEIFGRGVDFGTLNSLRPQLRDRVMQMAEVVYERAG